MHDCFSVVTDVLLSLLVCVYGYVWPYACMGQHMLVYVHAYICMYVSVDVRAWACMVVCMVECMRVRFQYMCV